MSVIAIPTNKQGKKGRKAFVIAAGSALVAVAVGVGVATWHGAGDGDAGTAAVRTPATSTTAVLAGGDAQPSTVYLVATSVAAEGLRMMLDHVEAIRDLLGLAPETGGIVVVSPGEDETRVTLAIDDADAVRAGLGLPSTTLLDLRPQ